MSMLILAGKVAGTTAIAAGALVTGLTATGGGTATSAADPGTSDQSKVRCATYAHVDDDLRAALKAARAKPAGKERQDAAKKIRKDVVAGKYGTKTEVAALHAQIRKLRLLAQAPDSLKAALKSAAAKPKGDERQAAVQQVWKDAAAGKYGDDVKKAAAKAQDRRDACQAKRSERKDKKKDQTQDGKQDSSTS